MRNVILLGASGSIGTSSLEVLSAFKKDFNLIGIAVKEDFDSVNKILLDFPSIKLVYIQNNIDKVEFEYKTNNIEGLFKLDQTAIIINGVGGIDGLKYTLLAIKYNLDIALANKESIVCGYNLIKEALKTSTSKIYPVDSEHSAIYQCMQNENNINKIILTCSGGPFYNKTKDELVNIKVEDAIKHPTWKMGKKISIDSASLFNKGLEIIEAHYLFNIDYSNIDVLIHKESIVHSLVEFKDGFMKAILSKPSMKLPILYALNGCKERLEFNDHLDLASISNLSFAKVDTNTFKSITLAYEAGKKEGNSPLVYCLSNEIAVDYFIKNKIKFLHIYDIVEYMVDNHDFKNINTIDELEDDIRLIRKEVENYIESMKGE